MISLSVSLVPSASSFFQHSVPSKFTFRSARWTRLEQWANLAMGGIGNAFLIEPEGLRAMADEVDWLRDSVRVFDGDFTEPSDKEVLVDVLLGLYGFSLLDESGRSNELVKLVKEAHGSVFPQPYFGDLISLLEQEVLLWTQNKPERRGHAPYVGWVRRFLMGRFISCWRCGCAWCCCCVYSSYLSQRKTPNLPSPQALTPSMRAEYERNSSLKADVLAARSSYSAIKEFDQDAELVSSIFPNEVVARLSAVSEASAPRARRSASLTRAAVEMPPPRALRPSNGRRSDDRASNCASGAGDTHSVHVASAEENLV